MTSDRDNTPLNDPIDAEIRYGLSPLKDLHSPPGLRAHLREAMDDTIRINSAQALAKRSGRGQPARPSSRSLWRRRISVPMPVAALVVLIVAFLAGRDLIQINAGTTNQTRSAPALESPQAALPANTGVITSLPQVASATITTAPPETNAADDFTLITRNETIMMAGLGSIAHKTYVICER